jgi:hypothetical protein
MDGPSLDELMAQFRQLESSSSFSDEVSSSSGLGGGGTSKESYYTPLFKASWYPYMVLLGGLLVMATLLVGIFRPSFMFSSDNKFVWKRFFIVVLLTFLFIVGFLYGMHYYMTKVANIWF